MTIKTLITILLLATSFLFFTACDSKTKQEETNTTVQIDTTSGNTGREDENRNDTADSDIDEVNTITGGETTRSGGSSNDDTSNNDNTTTDGGNDDNTNSGSDDNTSRNNDATTSTVTLTSLKLTIDKTSLNKDENTTVIVMATYSDNSTKEVTDKVEWVVAPSNAVKMTNTTLIALHDKTTTVKAKLNTVASDAVSLNITWVVNGHTLPPEPDEATNDATLLGIDINSNGVRDDVERYIYKRFGKDPDYPKTKVALTMQDAWATQKILENPTIESKKYLDDAIDCQYYWFERKQKNIRQKIIELDKTNFSESIRLSVQARKWRGKHKVFDDVLLKDKMLNTKQRILTMFKFNEACSGHIFHGRKLTIDSCLTNLDLIGE